MNILFWGITLGVIGKVLVVLAVLHMHHSLIREHKIDKKVILSYRQERFVTFIGLILIISGYLLEVWFYTPTSMFICEPGNCEAAILNALQ
jgi:hypothetical protein